MIDTLPAVLSVMIAALVDSINPCAIGVMTILVAGAMSQKKKQRHFALLCGTYIAAVFFTYLAAGFGLLYFLRAIPAFAVEYLSFLVAIALIVAAIAELREYFWHQQGFSLAIPHYFDKKIRAMSLRASVASVLLLGTLVSMIELACTGTPYLATIALLSHVRGAYSFTLLLAYGLVFIAPLALMLLLITAGVHLEEMRLWKKIDRSSMRLAISFLLVAMAWFLILTAGGVVSFL